MLTQQSTGILDMHLRKIQAGKSGFCVIVVFEKLHSQIALCHTKTKSRFLRFKERFRDELVWTEGQILEIKLRF